MSNDTNNQWYYQTLDGKAGPYDQEEMAELLTNGTLHQDSLVWHQGLDNWVRADDAGAFDIGDPEDQDALFEHILRKSWQARARHAHATQIDEVLVGAVITSTLDNGYSLIDLTSDGTYHYLRFEDLDSGDRIIFQLRHLTPSLATARVLGHEAEVTIGYGERSSKFNTVFSALRQELKGGYITTPDPGVITVDGDIPSQYIYVEVTTLWDINDYLLKKHTYRVNYPRLTRHIGAIIHSLRKYLHGRTAR